MNRVNDENFSYEKSRRKFVYDSMERIINFDLRSLELNLKAPTRNFTSDARFASQRRYEDYGGNFIFVEKNYLKK